MGVASWRAELAVVCLFEVWERISECPSCNDFNLWMEHQLPLNSSSLAQRGQHVWNCLYLALYTGKLPTPHVSCFPDVISDATPLCLLASRSMCTMWPRRGVQSWECDGKWGMYCSG
jgi:hypothetical protein